MSIIASRTQWFGFILPRIFVNNKDFPEPRDAKIPILSGVAPETITSVRVSAKILLSSNTSESFSLSITPATDFTKHFKYFHALHELLPTKRVFICCGLCSWRQSVN